MERMSHSHYGFGLMLFILSLYATSWVEFAARFNENSPKYFILKTGSYAYDPFAEALIERGWNQNHNYNSNLFHLKFARGREEVVEGSGLAFKLQPWQKVNHFARTGNLSGKALLSMSLKYPPKDYAGFLPSDEYFAKSFVVQTKKGERSFEAEGDEFKQEFRVVFAESFLKIFDGDLTLQTLVCLKIAERRLHNNDLSTEPLVTEAEWAVLQMSPKELLEKKNLLLEVKPWIRDL